MSESAPSYFEWAEMNTFIGTKEFQRAKESIDWLCTQPLGTKIELPEIMGRLLFPEWVARHPYQGDTITFQLRNDV